MSAALCSPVNPVDNRSNNMPKPVRQQSSIAAFDDEARIGQTFLNPIFQGLPSGVHNMNYESYLDVSEDGSIQNGGGGRIASAKPAIELDKFLDRQINMQQEGCRSRKNRIFVLIGLVSLNHAILPTPNGGVFFFHFPYHLWLLKLC